MPSESNWKNLISDNNFNQVRKALSNDFTAEILEILSDNPMHRRELSKQFDCHEATLYRRVDTLEETGLVENQNSFSNLHNDNLDNRVKMLYKTTENGKDVLETYKSFANEYESFDKLIGNNNVCYLLGTVKDSPGFETEIQETLHDAGITISARTTGRHLELLYDNGLLDTIPSQKSTEESYKITGIGEELIEGIQDIYSSSLQSRTLSPSQD